MNYGINFINRDINQAEEFFYSEEYNRCVNLVDQLLLHHESLDDLILCKLFYILILSLIRIGYISRANLILLRFEKIINNNNNNNNKFSDNKKEFWRSRYFAVKGEALESMERLKESWKAFMQSSIINSVINDKPNSLEPLLNRVELKFRYGLREDSKCLLSCIRHFLEPQITKTNLSNSLYSNLNFKLNESKLIKHSQSLRGDRREDLNSISTILALLMELKANTDLEHQLLFKCIGCVALQYTEILLREGATVKSILPHTAEHLFLASDAIEKYLSHLTEPFPAFTNARLKLIRLFIILGSENSNSVLKVNEYLEHALNMVDEVIKELSEISFPNKILKDPSLYHSWRWMHTNLMISALEMRGDIFTIEKRYNEASECFIQGIQHYNTLSNDQSNNNNNNNNKLDIVIVIIRLQVKSAEALTSSGFPYKSISLLQPLKENLNNLITTNNIIPSISLASVMHAMGNALAASHKLEESQLAYETALNYMGVNLNNLENENKKKEYDDDDILLKVSLIDRLANISLWRNDILGSLMYYRHSLRLRRCSLGEFHLDTAKSHKNLSDILFLLSRYSESEEHADICMRVIKNLYTGIIARHLHGDLANIDSNRRIERGSLYHIIPVVNIHSSSYLQHPLYIAAAKRKSECIQLLKKGRKTLKK